MPAKSLLVSLSLQSLALASVFQPRVAAKPYSFNYDDLSLREVGARNTKDWRIWLENKGQPISPWHDVPLWPDDANKQVVNFVVEIPRWTDAKIEIKRDEPLNPIFHDVKKGNVRFVESVWPHKSYPFLYGSIPQTWETPNVDHEFTGFPGDNDPIDLFDIGESNGYVGQVKQVKILGGLAVADGDETDWKMIGIDTTDPLAAMVDNWADVERYRPGLTAAFYDWFTYYKVPRGDEVIPIIGSTYQNASHMVSVLQESHAWWAELVRGEASDTNEINYNQTSNPEADSSYVESGETAERFDIPREADVKPPAEKPAKYDAWFYLDEDKKLIEIPV